MSKNLGEDSLPTTLDTSSVKVWEKLKSGYKALAILFLTSALCLLITNGTLWTYYRIQKAANPPKKYNVDGLLPAYPGWEREELVTLLRERAPLQCREPTDIPEERNTPLTVFRHLPYSGTYVNVSEAGFRHGANQGPWPPPRDATVVFVFGGSTTFGTGLPDDQTIPSYLQAHLRDLLDEDVNVYNFGQEYYFSRQEAALFANLLHQNHAPTYAVFIDGLNDSIGGGYMLAPPCPNDTIIAQFPLVRAAQDIRNILGETSSGHTRATTKDIEGPLANYAAHRTDGLLTQWWITKEQIEAAAEAHGVGILFVWQPVPAFQYDLQYHLLYHHVDQLHNGPYVQHAYEAMDRIIRAEGLCSERAENLLYLATIQQDRKENLYVDVHHYTGGFSDEIAEMIAQRLVNGSEACRASSSTRLQQPPQQ